ncbi:MAG: MFS transporter [Candidatus Adiutrix sp.]|jgi:MFS family permease|nr:MFS transporter [Candidatus Adiutrix sp.]
MFHNIFHFQTLGVPADSTDIGKNGMDFKVIERMASIIGFKLITCETNLEFEPDERTRLNNLVGCIEKLSAESEAIFLTYNNGMQNNGMDRILAPIIARRRPSFAQEGPSKTAETELEAAETETAAGERYFTLSRFDRVWQGRAIKGAEGRLAGYIFLSDPGPNTRPEIFSIFQGVGPRILGVAFFGPALLLLLIMAHIRKKSAGLSRAKMSALFLLPFLLAQIAFYSLAMSYIFDRHLEQNHRLAYQLAAGLRDDLLKISRRGVAPDQIGALDGHLANLSSRLPVIESLTFSPGRGPLEGDGYNLSLPLELEGNTLGQIELRLSASKINKDRLNLTLGQLTLTLAATLLLQELARIIFLKLHRESLGQPGGRVPGNISASLRPFVFMALMALDMSVSFVPLKMNELKADFLGLSPDLVCGLPISMEMAMVGLVMAFGGFISGRVGGWKPMFAAGLFLASAAYFFSALAASPGAYILARALAGLGYGLLNIAAQIFVVNNTPPENRGETLGDLCAGIFSGGLCGCVTGGLLAEIFGFRPVFLSSALIFAGLGLLFLIYFRDMPKAPRPAATIVDSAIKKRRRLSCSRSFIIFTLGSLVPSSLALVGLLNYFLPMRLNSLGAGSDTISQVNALLSLLVVIFSPVLGRIIDRTGKSGLFLVLAGVLVALTFPAFQIWPTLAGAVIAVVILGLAMTISENGQPVYLLNLPEAREAGEDRSLSVLNATTRVGQVLGPLVVAGAFGLWGLTGLSALGLTILIITIAFGCLIRPGKAT